MYFVLLFMIIKCIFISDPMEGETSELENLDSELVMSFYDQYHADDISKVYSNMPDKTGDTGVLDLKSSLTSSLAPDIAPNTSQVFLL